jgi:hypothetical protein
MSKLLLNWSKPRTLHEIDSEKIDDKKHPLVDYAGIYVWGFELDSSFYYYYIGKHKYVYWRLLEHAANIRSGLYDILDLNEIDSSKHLKAQFSSIEDKKRIMPNSIFEIVGLRALQ